MRVDDAARCKATLQRAAQHDARIRLERQLVRLLDRQFAQPLVRCVRDAFASQHEMEPASSENEPLPKMSARRRGEQTNPLRVSTMAAGWQSPSRKIACKRLRNVCSFESTSSRRTVFGACLRTQLHHFETSTQFDLTRKRVSTSQTVHSHRQSTTDLTERRVSACVRSRSHDRASFDATPPTDL